MAWVNVDGDTTSLEYTARRATAVIPSSPIQADVSTVYAFGTTPILRHNQLMPMGRLRGPRFVLKKAVVATHRFVIGHLFGFSEGSIVLDGRYSWTTPIRVAFRRLTGRLCQIASCPTLHGWASDALAQPKGERPKTHRASKETDVPVAPPSVSCGRPRKRRRLAPRRSCDKAHPQARSGQNTRCETTTATPNHQ